MILAAPGEWLQLCALDLTERHRSVEFARVLASNILVQVPMTMVEGVARLGSLAVTAFILVDLEFGQGPVIFQVVFAVIEGVLFKAFWHRFSPRRAFAAVRGDKKGDVTWDVVVFNKVDERDNIHVNHVVDRACVANSMSIVEFKTPPNRDHVEMVNFSR